VKLVHLVGFMTTKFVTMHCHTNVKYTRYSGEILILSITIRQLMIHTY